MPLGGLEGGGGGSAIIEVANYSALPSPVGLGGDLYAVLASQGTKWLPGSLGGTYYPKGLYYSDNVNWVFTETPYNANQATVDAGTNDDQFVTSKTFNDSVQLAAKAPLASPTFTGVVTTPDITVTGLTSTRVVFATTGGELTDDANFTFGSGNLNVGTSVTTPLVIGGSAVGSKVSVKATTGNGTLTSTGFEVLVGNNGATTAMQIFNSGNVNIGNASNTSARLVRIGQGTSIIDLGSYSSDSTLATIYMNASTPSTTNYAVLGTSTSTNFNAPTTQLNLRIADSNRVSINLTQTNFSSGAASSGALDVFNFTTPASTNQTLSTETIGVRFNMSATIQHATGAIATQRDFVINARTHAFVGASTITNSATLAITGTPIAGTNATLTNRYTIWAQNGLSNFGTQAPVNSMSTNGLAIEAVSNSRTLSLYSTNQAISKTFSFDSNTGADNASINHYGTTYAGNFTGTSLPLLKSFDIQNGGSASINSVVIRGTPIVNIVGVTSTNAGTRLDATGFRIGTLADVHTANTVAFELGEAMNMKFGTTTGTKIGTSTSQKIGLWNVIPIIQPANANQAAVATTVATTAATNVTPYGYTTQAQADDLITEVGELKVLVNQLRADLVAFGAIKGSA